MLDHPVRPKLQALLSQREELLWVGQPRGGLVFRGHDLYLVPVTLFQGVIMGTIGVFLLRTQEVVLVLIGLFLLSLAFLFTIGRFLFDIYLRANTYYGVTNRRIIIHRTAPVIRTSSFDLHSLNNLRVDVKKGGEGSIYFVQSPPNALLSAWIFQPFSTTPLFAFDLIPDAQRVYELIQDVRDG